MSRSITSVFEVHNMDIMRDTLGEMGINFTESKNKITIKRRYNDITINGNTNKFSYDDMCAEEVSKIKKNYLRAWYRDCAIKEGMQYREEVLANGEIEIHVHQ